MNLCSEDLYLFYPGLQVLPVGNHFLDLRFPGQCRNYKFELSNPCERKSVVMNSKGKIFPLHAKSRLKRRNVCLSSWVGIGNFFFPLMQDQSPNSMYRPRSCLWSSVCWAVSKTMEISEINRYPQHHHGFFIALLITLVSCFLFGLSVEFGRLGSLSMPLKVCSILSRISVWLIMGLFFRLPNSVPYFFLIPFTYTLHIN